MILSKQGMYLHIIFLLVRLEGVAKGFQDLVEGLNRRGRRRQILVRNLLGKAEAALDGLLLLLGQLRVSKDLVANVAGRDPWSRSTKLGRDELEGIQTGQLYEDLSARIDPCDVQEVLILRVEAIDVHLPIAGFDLAGGRHLVRRGRCVIWWIVRWWFPLDRTGRRHTAAQNQQDQIQKICNT